MGTSSNRIKDPPLQVGQARFHAARLSLPVSGPGEARIGPLIELPQLLRELKVSPELAFRRSGVPSSLFDDPDSCIRPESIRRLLSVCVKLSGRSDFGLLLGSRFTFDTFGMLGDLMKNSVTVSEAIERLVLHLHFYDRAAIPVMIRTEGSSVFLGYSLRHPEIPGTEQLLDAAIAIAHKMLRKLCGSAWRAQFVQFSHRRPGKITPYHRVFGPHVGFDAGLSGVLFAASWLDHEIDGADPALGNKLNRELWNAEQSSGISFAEQAQCVLHQLMPCGSTSAASVARRFGFSERTLRNKLQAEGTSMQRLLADTRFELARHFLHSTGLPIAQIAAALCYANLAVFSRAFHGWAGISPRQWRAAHRAGDSVPAARND